MNAFYSISILIGDVHIYVHDLNRWTRDLSSGWTRHTMQFFVSSFSLRWPWNVVFGWIIEFWDGSDLLLVICVSENWQLTLWTLCLTYSSILSYCDLQSWCSVTNIPHHQSIGCLPNLQCFISKTDFTAQRLSEVTCLCGFSAFSCFHLCFFHRDLYPASRSFGVENILA